MPKYSARGVLIDDQFIEVLELKRDRLGVKVSNYNWRKLQEGVVSRGRIVRPQILVSELKQLMAHGQAGPISGPVVLGLPQEQVFVKVFSMPEFEDKDLSEAISWHIGSLGQIMPKDAYTAHRVISRNDQGITVLLVAGAKDVVDEYISVADLAGIAVAAVEPVTFSRVRLVDPGQLANKTVLLTNLYAGQLAINILVDGRLWFSREIKMSEYDPTAIIQAVKELIKFFDERKAVAAASISQIIYSGDRSGAAVLLAALSGLKLPLDLAKPGWQLTESKVISEVKRIGLAPVLGLAMAGRLEEQELFNLMPDWPKQKNKAQAMERLSGRLALGVGLTSILIFIGIAGGWWWLKQDSRKLNQQAVMLQAQTGENAAIVDWANEFNQVVEKIGQIEKNRTSQAEVLKQLASLIPAGVKITAFSAEFNHQSWALTGAAENREAVLVFYDQLKNSPWFKEAKLFFSSLESNEGVVFRLSGGDHG